MSIPAASLSTDQALPSFITEDRQSRYSRWNPCYLRSCPPAHPLRCRDRPIIVFPPTQAESGLILLEEGIASLCHAENNMVISTIFAPSLLGLIDGYGVFNGIPEKHHCSLFAETDLRGRWIGHQAAVEILNAQNLWQEMAHVLAQRLMVLSMRSQEMMGVDSYLMVRTLLTELADSSGGISSPNQRPELYSAPYQPVAQPHYVDSVGAAQRWLHYGPSRCAEDHRPPASRPLLNPRGGGA